MELSHPSHVTADDGTRLVVHTRGQLRGHGRPMVCLPGGPMLDTDYLGDLGGLSVHRQLVLLDPRGTGGSDRPADPATYRCDHQVADVEALRRHLGLDRVDLLAHSAGANLAYRYAEQHPDRVARLVLVCPSTRALGIDVPDEARSEVARSRSGEPWYADAAAALARVQSGVGQDSDWAAISPFTYGRWDAEVAAYDDRMTERRDDEVAAAFGAEGAFDPPATLAALAALDVPVLVVAGAVDVGNPPGVMAEVAGCFPHAELVVQQGAGHFPWVDDPLRFTGLVAPFLDRTDD